MNYNKIILIDEKITLVFKSKYMSFYKSFDLISNESIIIQTKKILWMMTGFPAFFTCSLFQKGNNQINKFSGLDVYFKLKQPTIQELKTLKEIYAEHFI